MHRRQRGIPIQYLSDTFFLSLRGAPINRATKQSLSEIHQSNHSRLQLCNEIATPRQVGARNDTGGYCRHYKHIKYHPAIWTRSRGWQEAEGSAWQREKVLEESESLNNLLLSLSLGSFQSREAQVIFLQANGYRIPFLKLTLQYLGRYRIFHILLNSPA
jgi:hypothetical protein